MKSFFTMKSFYALLACMAVGSVANAELMATFLKDEALFGAGNNTYGLQVTTDTDWQTGSINIQLDSGELLNIDEGFPASPKATFAGLNDSGVFGGEFATPSLAPGAASSATAFNAAWGTTASDDIGTFYIGAFSLSPDANGTLSGRVVAKNPDDDINGFIFNLDGWSIVDGAIMQGGVDPVGPDLGPGGALDFTFSGEMQSLTLTNSGDEAATFGTPLFGGDRPDLFSLVDADLSDLPAGESRDFKVMLAGGLPNVRATYTADLTFDVTNSDIDPVFALTANVPEPSTVALAGLALVGMVGFARRK